MLLSKRSQRVRHNLETERQVTSYTFKYCLNMNELMSGKSDVQCKHV